MRTIHIRALSIGALAFVAFVGRAGAQSPSSAVLNAVEVQQLVSRAEPADHARLSAHFSALAERSAADARRHKTMAQGFSGNPNREMATGSRAHCTRLVRLNTQSATTLRELAAGHESLAAGKPAGLPAADAARFEKGEGAPAPADGDLSALATSARTAADHQRLEEYFVTLAKRYTADATQHAATAQAWRGTTRFPTAVTLAAHCDRLVKQLREAADEANAAAAMHKALAGSVR